MAKRKNTKTHELSNRAEISLTIDKLAEGRGKLIREEEGPEFKVVRRETDIVVQLEPASFRTARDASKYIVDVSAFIKGRIAITDDDD